MSMSEAYQSDSVPWTVYCPYCREAMRVAPEHVQMTVECPHCQYRLEPDQLVEACSPPPAPPSMPPAAGYGIRPPGVVSSRNKWIAGLLGIVLGSIGVHRFYLGFVGIGILQIFLTCITFGIAGVWGMIEGFLCFFGMMRDVDGLPLRD